MTLGGGAAKTIVADANLDSATLDACNVYYYTASQTAQSMMKISKL
ncbi:MAG TPA: hypothetical protein VIA18_04365 [Polyangia bacterium]|nr:hypothetical protein [Polyangia bacterium]HWE29315.1 hypothetical protein [Polyangia bacterium]